MSSIVEGTMSAAMDPKGRQEERLQEAIGRMNSYVRKLTTIKKQYEKVVTLLKGEQTHRAITILEKGKDLFLSPENYQAFHDYQLLKCGVEWLIQEYELPLTRQELEAKMEAGILEIRYGRLEV